MFLCLSQQTMDVVCAIPGLALTVLHDAPHPLFSLIRQLGSKDPAGNSAGVGGAWWKESGPDFLCEAETPSSLCWTMAQMRNKPMLC